MTVGLRRHAAGEGATSFRPRPLSEMTFTVQRVAVTVPVSNQKVLEEPTPGGITEQVEEVRGTPAPAEGPPRTGQGLPPFLTGGKWQGGRRHQQLRFLEARRQEASSRRARSSTELLGHPARGLDGVGGVAGRSPSIPACNIVTIGNKQELSWAV